MAAYFTDADHKPGAGFRESQSSPLANDSRRPYDNNIRILQAFHS
ncbi:MAG: hypothetical protein JWO30_4501 [Fibrobacteres bacterium]|nr:hypothetical protein [Fibrobacterota bacterium]